jgi:curved DNA-binding protein CbpA
MGASGSRIWAEICALQSDDVRAHMIETVSMSPELVREARYVGYYADVMAWLAAYRRGQVFPFPYRPGGSGAGGRDTIQHDTPRWTMYTTPLPGQTAPSATHAAPTPPQRAHTYPGTGQELIVSPAAKALDYFQECLELLGIGEQETLTPERLKAAFKRASLTAHPDKGGSPEAFDALNRAYTYVGKILARINPNMSAAEKARMTAAVTMESATAYRQSSAPAALPDQPPVALSAKKLDMGMFNKLFEENRLPDPARDSGYGDWMKSQGGSDDIAMDARLKGKVTPQNFEAIFRERALQQAPSTAITRRLEPDALVAPMGYELGGEVNNFTASFGSDTQFTDLKEAYTTGATVFQEVADVKVRERSARTVGEAEKIRAEEMARVDPDEKSRIAAAAAALEERERQRRLRLAQQDTATEGWHDALRRRLLVNH